MLLSAVFSSLHLDSVGQAWKFLLTFASGAGLVWILRWFWWRVNAISEITSMVLSGISATYLQYCYPEIAYGWKLVITVSISTCGWILATYLSKPDSEESLKKFISRVQPPGLGWKIIYSQMPDLYPQSLGRGLIQFLLGLCVFFSLNLSFGSIILGQLTLGLVLLSSCIISGLILLFSFRYGKSS